ncbi:hypothetical protein BDZ94DRAFT_1284436 [Collybia nuda]|uniref:PHD-type domain-containing protein n=1 Tax=Collybia nuda TaxID=64659 RepID=A0A9P5XYD4_9AGAR|nr:hypothetical protein BDZ94DRAFT_1284436 [Collybia nuda]
MASTASLPSYMLSGVPVHHPSHLDGDASLATEILPGPPSLVSTQQSVLKRDPRKPSTVFSYLPPSDPGSTYSGIMHGTLIGHEHEGARSKRPKTATGRAQRANARNQNGTVATLDLLADSEGGSTSAPPLASADSESYTMVLDDEPSISRSNSLSNLQEPPPTNTNNRPKRKQDKGKGREVEPLTVRVKEEPKLVSLQSPEPSVNMLNNEDHCSSCRSHGALVYCDGCPRAFHLWCLNPPIESVDEGDSRWFCPACTIEKHPPRKPPPSFLSSLIHQVETAIPTEFQLPEDLRNFFKDVVTGPRGSYVDTTEVKSRRNDRQYEERNPYQLKDKNGAPALCFRCGTSALPPGLAAPTPATKRARRSTAKMPTPETGKSILSCDHCPLFWHLDCLDPPLPCMPPNSKKWMCPNHVDQILLPKPRIPKQATAIEITKPNQFNNGNIEIIHPQTPRVLKKFEKVTVDEVLINGRRYRVPEKVIVLDFWNKLNKSEKQEDKDSNVDSVMSSPLTSLSSLDDLDEHISSYSRPVHDTDDFRVAQLLCSLQGARPPFTRPAVSAVNGASKAPASPQSIIAVATELSTSTLKRKKPTPAPQPSTRELRSRSRNNFDSSLTSISSRSSVRRMDGSSKESLLFDGSMSAPPIPMSKLHVKVECIAVEEIDTMLGNNTLDKPLTATPAKRIGRTRAPRRTVQVDPSSRLEEKEKRGRKRKERDDDELPGIDSRNRPSISDRPEKEKKEKEKEKERKKPIRTPSRQQTTTMPVITPTPATPSLKIRLPRLGNVGTHNTGPAMPNNNGDTPTML